MTYELQTLNFGQIEAGYFSVFTQEVRMGDFSIQTDKFCKFVAEIAVGGNFLRIPTVNGSEVCSTWNQKQKVVKVGKYEIGGEEFSAFADYVFHGGFFGWKPNQPEWKPGFVENAIDYVRDNMHKIQKGSYLNSIQQKQFLGLEEKL